MAPRRDPSPTVFCSRIQMRRFLLCSATFLFLAVSDTNGSNDREKLSPLNTNGSHDNKKLSPLVKDLCKYIIHFKRKHFKLLEALPGSETISNDDTAIANSSEPLVTASEKYKSLNDEYKQNQANDKSHISKIQSDKIEESPEFKKGKPENDSHDDMSDDPSPCNKAIDQQFKTDNYNNAKNENHKNNDNSYDKQNESKLYLEAHVVCSECNTNQNNNDIDCDSTGTTGNATPNSEELQKESEDIDSSNQTSKTNITECNENCFSNGLGLKKNHNDTVLLGRCHVDACLDHFLPYFKRCKLKVCKKQENISEGLNNRIHEDSCFSCQKYNEKEYIVVPSENRTTDKTGASITTDFNEESASIQPTTFSNKHEDNLYLEFEREILSKSEDVSGDASDSYNISSFDPTTCKLNECSKDEYCEKNFGHSGCEDASRVCGIPKSLRRRSYRKHCCPRVLVRKPKHCNFINSNNCSRQIPQIPRGLFLSPFECERKCKKYDTESCSETNPMNKSQNVLCLLSLTGKQDCYHNFINDGIEKFVQDLLASKTNISDESITNQKHPWSRFPTIIFYPIFKPLDYNIPCEQPSADQTISQPFCNDGSSCSNETCFNKDENEELIPIKCKICDSKLADRKRQKIGCCIRNNKKPNIDCFALSKSKIDEIHDSLDEKQMTPDLSDISLKVNSNEKSDECSCEKFLCETPSMQESLEKNNQCSVPINLCQSDTISKSSNNNEPIINDNSWSEETKNRDCGLCNGLITDSKNTSNEYISVSKLSLGKMHNPFKQQYRNKYIVEINSHNNAIDDSNKYENSLCESFPCEITQSLALGKEKNLDCSRAVYKCSNRYNHGKKFPKTCRFVRRNRCKKRFY